MNRLRIPVARRARKLRSTVGLGSGPQGRIERIRYTLTELMRHERLEGSFTVMDESRGYAELLIQQAVLYGPESKETIKMAEYWLLEKDLVHKLFNVLVPRFQNYTTSYTQQFQLPNLYPSNRPQAILELKENPWPTVINNPVDNSKWIHNVLLDAVRKNMGVQMIDGAVRHDTQDQLEGSAV